MATKQTIALMAGLILLATADSYSQRGRDRDGGDQSQQGTIDYRDLSRRNTASKEREDRKAKEAEEAKKKAEEEKRRAEREKRGSEDAKKRGATGATTIQAKATTDSKEGGKAAAAAAGKPGAPAKARQPVNTGGSADPTTKEVTEVMLNAVKTQTVNFDPEKAKQDPDVIILNAPKFDPTQRTRAGDADIAAPL